MLLPKEQCAGRDQDFSMNSWSRENSNHVEFSGKIFVAFRKVAKYEKQRDSDGEGRLIAALILRIMCRTFPVS